MTTDANAPENEMKIDPARASALASQFSFVQARIAVLASPSRPVRLVAVSKLKPANDILALHRHPLSHDHFGENYAQELVQKAALLPPTIKWHFIGALQSTHCKALARVPNLWVISSLDSLKKAHMLDRARGECLLLQARQQRSPQPPSLSDHHDGAETRQQYGKLSIHIQINTSSEPTKAGLAPFSPDLVPLARALCSPTELPNLRLLGLMTIGSIARSAAKTTTTSDTENEDFLCLRGQRDWLAAQLDLEAEDLELSMGMSGDFEGAVRLGSGEVRLGSTIFGERGTRADARVVL